MNHSPTVNTIKKIYIAGPMSGYTEYNYPEFFRIEDVLAKKGISCVNPARIANLFGGQKLFVENKNVAEKIINEQIKQEKECDSILLLNGWNYSKGSIEELKIALTNNLKIYMQNELV